MATLLPQIPQNNFVTDASDSFQKASNNLQPSAASLDTAAARVRSRLAGQFKANEQLARDRAQSVGRGVGGLVNQGLRRARADNTNALAQAFTDLELGFEDKKIDAARAATDLGTAQGGLGTALTDLAIRLDDINKSFELGQGELGIKEGQLDLGREELIKTEEEGIRRALIEVLGTFGEIGNTQFSDGRDNIFDTIISRLFGIIPVDEEFDFPEAPALPAPDPIDRGEGT